MNRLKKQNTDLTKEAISLNEQILELKVWKQYICRML